LGQELLVTVEVVQKSFRTRRALEVFWWLVADGEDAQGGSGIERRRGVFASGGTAPQDGLFIGRCGEQAFDPLLDPVVRAPDLVSVLLIRPGGMGAQQFTQMGTVSHEWCFFHANDSKHEN
jgi:hypothetical protein